jgi:cyclic-di-GMP phosphodiesterase, flagellum assembly factor TipF
MRPSIALIYGAMAVISASLAALLYRLSALPLEVAGLAGAIVFFALAVLDQSTARRTERKRFEEQLALSDHALQDAFNEIDMVRSRLVALETDTQQMVEAAVSPIAQDIQAIGALLGQVTEAVSDSDYRLAALEEGLQGAGVNPGSAAKPLEKNEDQPAPPKAREPLEPPLSPAAEDARTRALLKRVRVAVEGERIDVAMQSIVTLPQRRARAYATLFSLKLDGAGTLEARHAIPAIEAVGMTQAYDKAVTRRALALADRFAARESASMVFVPLTGSALMESRFADWLVGVLGQERQLAGRLVIEIAQKDIRAFSPIDFDLLGSLADMGFRMCVSQLVDARSDLFDLSSHGFRYAKAPASLFLGSSANARSDIHPQDLSDMAARNGMDLIVDQVESEAQLVELLDCKLKYAQGNLFARPRVVDVAPRPDKPQEQPVQTPEARAKPPAQPTARPAASALLAKQAVARAAPSADQALDPATIRPGRPLSRQA